MRTISLNRYNRLVTLTTLFLLGNSIQLVAAAVAQAQVQNVFNAEISPDGSVRIDTNAFDLFTGELNNSSNIPLPAGLIVNPTEGVAQPVRRPSLAPNSIRSQVDLDNVNQQLQPLAPGFTILRDSLDLTTQFDLVYIQGAHAFGEGIQVTVFNPDGSVQSIDRAFVRGDAVLTGPNGETLPGRSQINVTYDAEDTVELRVLNIRANSAPPSDSGIYFTIDGDLAVEDAPNGGDLDFNDGEYFRQSAGLGIAQIESETQTISESISFRTTAVETPLDPLLRQDQTTTESRQQREETFTEVSEETQSGEIEIRNPGGITLPHAYGARTANDDHLVYDQYVGTAQVRVGSDGASLIGQFSPLVGQPSAAPTLLTGVLRFNPFADNNEAGIDATVGLTQFITPTHEEATDMFGQVVVNPDPEGPRLIQPTGLFHDTQLVGYVAPVPDQVIPGQRVTSINGIFDLPPDQAITIAPPDPAQVGPGNAAFTRNVGGLIIEAPDGTAEFIPQWNYQGYRTEPITLEAGTASRVIYALVPEQANQDLQLGQTYALTANSRVDGLNRGYRTTDGGLRVISADINPENFYLEQADIYGVEDTLASGNYAISIFNGVQGFHRLVPGGELIATVDVDQPTNVDARVGTEIVTPEVVIPGVVGQPAFLTTSRAAAFYVRGSLALGLGNQEDTITTTTSTFFNQTDAVFRQTTTNTFATPRTQVDTSTTELAVLVTENTRQTGSITFDITPDGLINNANIQLNQPQIDRSEVVLAEGATTVDSTVRVGAEALVSSTEELEIIDLISSETTLLDRQVTIRTQSSPNFSPLLGEFAVGGVLNLGNTPWTPAANTLRLEAFARGTVIGQSSSGGNFGWRAEAVFNPFGEEQRPAFSLDQLGNLIPLYQTQPLLDADGNPTFSPIADVSGETIQVVANEFLQNDAGERMTQMVGTGRAIGPGIYFRIEDIFDSQEGLAILGGIKFDL